MNLGLLSSFSISLGDLELATDYVNNEDSSLSSEVDTIKQTVFNKPATKKSKRTIIKPEITHEKLMKKFSIIKPEALNIDSELIEDTTDISLEDVNDFTFSFDTPEPELEKDKIDEILDNDDEDTSDDEPYDIEEDEEPEEDEDEQLNLDDILNEEDDDINEEDEEPEEDEEDISNEDRGLAALQLQQMLKAQQNSPPAVKKQEELDLDSILDEDDDEEPEEDEPYDIEEDEDSDDEEDEDSDDEDLSAFLKQVNAVKQVQQAENKVNQTENKVNQTVTEIPKQQEVVKQAPVEKVEAVNIDNKSTKEKELELEAEKLRLEREKLELENKKLELEKLKAEQELARFKDMDIQEIIRKAQEEALKKLQESQAENKESNNEKETEKKVSLEQEVVKPVQQKVEKKTEVAQPKQVVTQTKQVVAKPKQVVKKEVTPIKSHNIVDNISEETGKVETAQQVNEVHQENKNPYLIYDNMAMDSLSATVKKYMIANGVKLKPISEEVLNNKFGKHNIKKLIRASYLISTGKGITMGI